MEIVVFVFLSTEHPANQLLSPTNPLISPLLYYTAAAQLAALQAQSIQPAQLQTFTDPIWLPPFVWPNLNSICSTAGNQVSGTKETEVFNGVNRHQVKPANYSTATRCSVIKTIGNVDGNKRNQFCASPKI